MRDLRVGKDYAFVRHPPSGVRLTPAVVTAFRVRVRASNVDREGFEGKYVEYDRIDIDGTPRGNVYHARARCFVMFWPHWQAEQHMLQARQDVLVRRIVAPIEHLDLDDL